MESLEESNCHSLSDSFSLYERYLRSFNVVDNIVEDNQHDSSERASIINDDYESSTSGGNIDLSAVYTNNLLDKQCVSAELQYKLLDPSVCKNIEDKGSDVSYINIDVAKTKSNSLQAVSLHDNSSITIERSLLNDQSEHTDIRFSSEDSKPEHFKQPIFITSTMENSNNAVDSVPMFRNIRPSENMFKLPITELSFNGTIKHVQKLKPIVDPITALSSNSALVTVSENVPIHNLGYNLLKTDNITDYKSDNDQHASSTSDDQNTFGKQNKTESIGNSQFEELNGRKDCPLLNEDGNSAKWNSEQSYSSLEASFDSGVRSPDMFSDEDVEVTPEPFWSFLKDYEFYDKKRVKKTELILQGVLPPPSVTVLKTDVTQMLKKYYCFLPAFSNDEKVTIPESNTVTPTKRVSFVHIPIELGTLVQETASENVNNSTILDRSKSSLTKNKNDSDMDVSSDEKRGSLKTCTQIEAAQTPWPEVLKCRHYDIYYNTTKYSEQFECLALRFGERFVGAETDTSVSIHSGGLQSPSSASKRKALRLAQAKSPGRRLSHLARRRQTFCSAATISEKAQTTASKMVLIDKNFFPHRKLINTSERRSPRKLVMRRTPGKKTPLRKTPGKKTPAKTPKTKSGGSSRKKAMRRLLMDTENITRSQPTRESLKRALFVSPEGRRTVPTQPSTSVPLQAMKSKRALFGSPSTAETKSCDGIQSDQFLKRKRDALDDEPMNNRSKIAKSLSLGWDTVGTSQSFSLSRRASEVVVSKSMAELNDHHKQKLLWAVSSALRVHGMNMSSAGFREKASLLARLTRKLLTLPPHAARLHAPNHSTSDTMLKVARLYVYPIIQGRTVEDCFEEEKTKLANEAKNKISGYISASAYQQLKVRQTPTSTFTSQIKENTCSSGSNKQEQPRSNSKNILQDKLVNIDSNSNSSSGLSLLDKNNLSLFKSNSMPSFEEAAKMRARRQISFDNVDFPKR